MATKTLLKSVILVESAAKARTLRKFISRSFAVLSTEGFLQDLPKSRIGVDVEKNYSPDYITVRGQGKLLAQLKRETLNARRIFLATNPDARGEFLARQCCEIFGVNPKSFCRLRLNELTRAAFNAALENASPIDENLADSFQAKQILDKIVSHRVGEYFERKIYRGTKVGRFRAMLLKLIANLPAKNILSPKEKLTPETLQELAFKEFTYSAGRTHLVAIQLYEGIKLDGDDAGLITYPDAEEIFPASERRKPEDVKEFLTDYQFKLYGLIYAHANGQKFGTCETTVPDDANLMAALDSLGVEWAQYYAGGISSLIKRKYIVAQNSGYSVTELGKKVLDALNGFFDEIFSADAYNSVTAQIHQVAAGEVKKIAVIDNYCKKFNPAFDSAMATLGEDSAPIDEPIIESDVVCEKCGRKMLIRHGRYGNFLACPGYPECKNTKPFFEPTEQTCPKCGAKLLRRTLPRGLKFYCCERTPDCDFSTWDEPQAINCQYCGATMFVHRFRGRAPMFYCGNENCSTRKNHPVNKILADMRARAELRRERKEQLAVKAAEKSVAKPARKKSKSK
ncbi:MAG: topoisomerase DNA-binding C4 zinc finger domain-containing protein [Selenomonadaceae bacterium]|nr:topoisomerase DNA-binding C4 zinc finger domain-containing protein [Selenomonadaceae bacterium]